MNRHLENLNNRPSHEKRRIAMQASALIMSMVFVVWVSTLGSRIFNQISPDTEEQVHVADGKVDVLSMMASVGSTISSEWGKTKAMISVVGSNPSWNGEGSTSSATVPSAVDTSAAPASSIVIPIMMPIDSGSSDTGTTNESQI